MIKLQTKGSFKKTERLLGKMSAFDVRRILDKYGREGVSILSKNTPTDSGRTASSWYYKTDVNRHKGIATVTWCNSNVVKGTNIAIILQYGHGTRNGGYVRGRDYVNPAIGPIFDVMAEDAWKEVTSV